MAGKTKLLETNNKCPIFNQATTLVVGVARELNEVLANALVSTPKSCKLKVHLTSGLPLPDKQNDERPRIDYVIFIVDIANKQSLQSIKDSLQAVDVNYFFGKACLVVTEVDLCDVDVEMERVSEVAGRYSLPIFKVNLQSPTETSTAAEKLLTMIEISAGLRPGISALLIDTTRQHVQTATTSNLT